MKVFRWQTYKQLREEASLGSATPEMNQQSSGVNNPAPASAEVQKTNLQPQVDAKPTDTKAGLENDRIGAINADMERFDASLPDENSDTPRVNQFRTMWKQLKDQWELIKTADSEDPQNQGTPLNQDMGDPNYMQKMQKFPNMMPGSPVQPGEGPGTMGNS